VDHAKWLANDRSVQADLVAKQATQKEEYKEYKRNLKTKVKTYLNDKKEVGGMQISPIDKTSLPSYLVDEIVPTENGKNITKFYSDLSAALADEAKSVILAKLLRSDFDFSKFQRNAKTEIAKEVKAGVRRNKLVPSRSVGSSQKNKTLADYF